MTNYTFKKFGKRLAPLVVASPLLMMLAGCPTQPTKQENVVVEPEKVAPPPETPDQIAARQLAEAARADVKVGKVLFDSGDYNGAIKRLSAPDSPIWKADASIQVEALKYMAFSNCVTGKTPQCRQNFEKAFKLDPNFTLLPGEMGHPIWGPVYERVKRDNRPK